MQISMVSYNYQIASRTILCVSGKNVASCIDPKSGHSAVDTCLWIAVPVYMEVDMAIMIFFY